MNTQIHRFIKQHILFKHLSETVIAAIAAQFVQKKYETGQYIFQQGDKADRLYLILSGQISVETYSLNGKPIKITTLGTGSVFGEFALIDEASRSASIVVTRKTELASLSALMFKKILNKHPSISHNMLRILVTHLRSSNKQIESLVSKSLLQRTANLLIELNKLEGPIIRLTQKQLSEKLFASREKVNFQLKKLEEKNAIKRGHRMIEILSINILQQIAE